MHEGWYALRDLLLPHSPSALTIDVLADLGARM